MGKRIFRAGLIGLLFVLVWEEAALADMIEGRVAKASSYGISMVVYDAQGRPYPNPLDLKVDGRTAFEGVPSVAALRPNDAVSAEVRREESGQWRADRVKLFQEINARPATQRPSPSLRDVLGNPVARGALTGAATGAIAASASGGKAGKGALIGAGVGAAAGLLEGMFSQRPQDSSSSNSDQ